MNETQKKEYEELARKRNYFLEMMKLMTNKMTQSQSLTPNKLFKNYNDNQNEKNINDTQEIYMRIKNQLINLWFHLLFLI